MVNKSENTVHEHLPDYEKAGDDLIRKALRRSYTERFHVMTNLMKMSLMLGKGTIKHKTLPSAKISSLIIC